MSITNITKSSASSCINSTKNAAAPQRYGKAGAGWDYDQTGITYDGQLDPVTGLPVFYDSLGTTPTVTNLTKNSA
jgi:hypothetical protein